MKINFTRLSRWLHIYLSMISFFIVLFFSITGITLSHTDWFQSQVTNKSIEGKIDSSWTNQTDTLKIDKLRITEYFRNTQHAQGAVNDFRIDEREVSFVFKGPGYEASIFVNREDGAFQFNETSYGLVGKMNDLHKGRDTGRTWIWFMDASAVFLILVSLTGLILLLFLKKKRLSGIIVSILGLLVMYLVYYFGGV